MKLTIQIHRRKFGGAIATGGRTTRCPKVKSSFRTKQLYESYR